MRISYACRVAAFVLLLVLLPALAGAAEVKVPDMVEILTPTPVGVGKPFLVRVTSWYPMRDLRVAWKGKTVRPEVTEEGGKFNALVLLGVGLRGDVGTYPIDVTVDIWGHERQFATTVDVVESTWQKETLTVEPKLVKPPAEVMDRIRREREQINAALETVSAKRYWEVPFTRPVKGKMLSRFGLHRVFNGDTKARHTGLDFRAWMGTPLHAMAGGTVVLTGNFYYAGNAVYIDHGNGLISMSGHMSKILVKEGDVVRAGQTIGLSGATGRVTGAHLHLATFVLGEVVDPELFFNGALAVPE